MTRPLYSAPSWPQQKNEHAHAGLWFDRFFDRYQADWTLNDTAKTEWIHSMTGSVGQNEALENYTQRLTALTHQLIGKSVCYQSDWHFVTGMGNPHPVENGLSWHPTLGVPYLTGAAVKGLIRAWVELNDEELSDHDKNQRLRDWFGTADKQEVAEQAGGFIFMDAVPNQQPALITDIMTPHMGQWYAEGDKATVNNPETVPADWHDPVPVSFLAVKEISLVFHIAPRSSAMAEQLDDVLSALQNALTWLGAGAKTAAGYGYMYENVQFQQDQLKQQLALQREAEKAALSPAQKTIYDLREQLNDYQAKNLPQNINGPLYQAFRQTALTAINEWSPEERSELGQLGQEIVTFIGAKKSQKAKQLLKDLQA